MAERQWWQRAQLRTDNEHEERKVSWLELFFDLVFVVVIAEAAHYLSSHVSIEGALGYVLLFVPIWWAWIAGVFYNARFESEDLSSRAFTFLLMLPVAAMAIFSYNGLGKTANPFALAYIANRLIVIGLWLRAGWHVPVMRPVTSRYAIGFSLSVVLFVASLFVAPPFKFGLWGLGLVLDLITPVWTLPVQANLPRLSSAKMPERFGLFVIIVLGEAIVGVVRGLAENEAFDLTIGLNGVLGIALAFGLWWVYFDFIVRQANFRRPKAGVWWLLGWSYTHLPLVMAIAAVGAGTLNLLTLDSAIVDDPNRWLLTTAVALVLGCIGCIEVTLQREPDEPTNLRTSVALKFAAALLALVIGALGSGISVSGLLLALLLLVGLQMAYGAYVWFRTPVVSVSSAGEAN